MAVSETLILCEGYHDRAFWAGLVATLGWSDARNSSSPPWKNWAKGGGQFGYEKAGRFLRIAPRAVEHDGGYPAALRFQVASSSTQPKTAIIVSLDNDGIEAAQTIDIAGWLSETDVPAGLEIIPVAWRSREGLPDVPRKHTLERLVCAAMLRVHPPRAASVAAWLQGRPNPTVESGKSWTWSYMAGWHPDHGCEGFLKSLWADSLIRDALIEELKAVGDWNTICRVLL